MGGGGLISDAQQVADRVGGALESLESSLPSGVRIQVQPDVEEIDEATGMVTGFQTVEPPDAAAGAGTGGYSGPTGAVINWRTNDLRNGRRIRGRTFIVPLAGSTYQPDGTLQENTRGNIQNMADALMGGDFDSELVVWSRPINGSGGVAATVVQANVPDLAAVLRSRRD